MAQTALATMYRDGNGLAKDAMKAVELYAKAAVQGYPPALEVMARITQQPRSNEEQAAFDEAVQRGVQSMQQLVGGRPM